MALKKLLAALLITAGALALVYGKLTYTATTHEAKLGPFQLSVKDRETVQIPVWAGAGAIAAGTLLLLFGKRR